MLGQQNRNRVKYICATLREHITIVKTICAKRFQNAVKNICAKIIRKPFESGDIASDALQVGLLMPPASLPTVVAQCDGMSDRLSYNQHFRLKVTQNI